MEESFSSILNSMSSPDGRRKKSYLNTRSREKLKVKRAADVKDSISKFLDLAQHEDMIFNVSFSPNAKLATPTGQEGSGLSSRNDHFSQACEVSPLHALSESLNKSRQLPFSQKSSARKPPSHVKTKLKRNGPKRRAGKDNEQPCNNFDVDEDDDDDDLNSFAVDDGEDDDDVSLSSAEEGGLDGRRSRPTHHRQTFKSPGRMHQRPERKHSVNSRLNSLTSSSRLPPRRSQSLQESQPRRHHTNLGGGLSSNLGALERDSRRSRLKQYRTQSGVSNHRDDDDGSDSVLSSLSTMSTRSRRNSGLEGGALNAFLGDETIARNASCGKGIVSWPSTATASVDEKFMKDRKARQDLIMDAAMKEKWQYESRAREEAELVERIQCLGVDNDDLSDDDDLKFGKKKGVIGNLKRAARKSAKLTKSGAKGTVNVVKDPKRAAKKVGGFAMDVGKETTRMVLDPSLAAKRTAKGVKETVKLTTKVTGNVAKGGYGVTKSIAKTGVKGTSKVVGKTIDGVVHGATGLFVRKDEDLEGTEYAEYDPKDLTNRRRKDSLLDRFAEDERRSDDVHNGISVRMSDILAPTIDTGRGGSWDV